MLPTEQAIIQIVSASIQIRHMPDDALRVLRDRASKRHLSLAAYAREVLVREASRGTIEETLAGPRLLSGPRLSDRQLKQLIQYGR